MGRRMLEGLFETVRVGLKYPPFVEFAFDNDPPALSNYHPLNKGGVDYKTVLLEIGNHTANVIARPDPEGGSDSESSAEDISKSQKQKLMDNLEHALDQQFSPDEPKSDRKIRRKSKNPAKSQIRIKLLQQNIMKKRPLSRKETERVTASKETSYLKPKDRSQVEEARLSKQTSHSKIGVNPNGEPSSFDRFPYGFPSDNATYFEDPSKEPGSNKLWKPPTKPRPPGFYSHKHRALEYAVSQKLLTSGRWLGEEGGKFKIHSEQPGLLIPKKVSGLISMSNTPHGLLDSATQTGKSLKPHGQSVPVKQVKISNLILEASDFIPAKTGLSAKQRASKPDFLNQTRFASLSKPALK